MVPLNSNSTTTVLNNGATFTGAWFDVTKDKYSNIIVIVNTDKNGILYIDLSIDEDQPDETHSFTVTGGTTTKEVVSLSAKYVRVRFFNNSGSAQTTFRLSSSLSETRPTEPLEISGSLSFDTSNLSTSANQTNGLQKTKLVDADGTTADVIQIGTQVTSSDNGLVTNAVIHGKTTAGGGSFVDVKVNPSGALTTASSQDGTWTVQPGNTQNTTPWKVQLPDGSNQTVSQVFTGATQALVLETKGAATCTFMFSPALDGLAAAYGSVDGTNWQNIQILSWDDMSQQTYAAGSTTYQFSCAGFYKIRIYMIVLSSGTPTCYAWLSPAQSGALAWSLNHNTFKTKTQLVDTGGDVAAISASGEVSVTGPVTVTNGTQVSTVNSTTAALNNAATFTGTWEDTTGFSTVTVAALTDKAGTLYIEFSPDGSNADSSLSFSVAASTNEVHRFTCTRKYFRVRFTNGSGSNQTYLRLQSIFGHHQLLTSALNGTIQSDADTIVTRSILYGQQDNGDYSSVPIDENGHLEVALHSPRLPFHSIHTESITPVFQDDAVYGLNTTMVTPTSSGSGSVTASDSCFVCSTGTTIYSQAVLQSVPRLRYVPGQGVIGRFTSSYTSPVASSYQLAGFGHAEDGVYIGYKDTEFGILYVNRGVRETQTLTISTASTTNQNCTVTLAGTAFSVAITNSGSTAKTAYEISIGTYTGWKAEQIGSTVVFVADSVGNKTGTFSLTATTAVGTFAETKAGVASTDTWIPQSSWNGDKLNGTGPSAVTIDPTKLNVFQIGIQYLGAGSITFQCECSSEGNNPEWVTVHTLRLPNSLTTTSFGNPSFPFTMAAYSAGSTTNLTVKVGSFAGFIEGTKKLQGPRFSYFDTGTSVSNSAYTTLSTIRNTRYYAGRTNQGIINVLSISAAQQHNNTTSVFLIKNATLVGTPSYSQFSTNSMSYIDQGATTCTFTNDQVVWSGQLGATSNLVFSFTDDIRIQPGETLTLAARATAGNPTVIMSLNTREDQ